MRPFYAAAIDLLVTNLVKPESVHRISDPALDGRNCKWADDASFLEGLYP